MKIGRQFEINPAYYKYEKVVSYLQFHFRESNNHRAFVMYARMSEKVTQFSS